MVPLDIREKKNCGCRTGHNEAGVKQPLMRIGQGNKRIMKILMINKFLYPNGGSETYIFKLGEVLKSHGHDVQYFGMEHKGLCVGNAVNAYTQDMDFHTGSPLKKLTYLCRTIYSSEARRKLRQVLEDFKPEVCHLNNFNYQLTPSIILEIRRWEKQSRQKVKIIYTAHDYQLVCPNHMMNNPITHKNCEKCVGGAYVNCIRGRCIHNSTGKSVVGALEAAFWRLTGSYKQIDTIICPSQFMKSRLDLNPVFRGKTTVMLNFIDMAGGEDAGQKERVDGWEKTLKKDYVLYFGRFSEEKGIRTLISVCKELPHIPFVFAGAGPLEAELSCVKNIQNVGFRKGASLEALIREARFTICPSEWYENCPFSVMESQLYGTPVIGADIGGIPELIQDQRTGELFQSGNGQALKAQIQKLWEDTALCKFYSRNCGDISFDNTEQYYMKYLARIQSA